VNEQRDRHIARDDLVGALHRGASAAEVLHAVRAALAVEAASLRWQREHLEETGRNGAEQVATRRIDALTALARLELERVRLGLVVEDPSAERVQRIFELFLRDVERVARATLGDDLGAAVVDRLRGDLEGWEARV